MRIVPGSAGRSLRFRVTAAAVAVVALAFVLVGVAVEVLLGVTLRRDEQSVVDDRVARATVLVAQGTTPADLVPLVDGQGVRAVVVGADGRRLAPVRARPAPGSDAVGPVEGSAAAADGPRGRLREPHATIPLADGARLVLAADPAATTLFLGRLRTVLLVVGALGLVLTATALSAGVRIALRPLDAMTGLARAITGGDRGRRLRPARTDTELGRTARAFDEMLDALDAAQAHAEAAAEEARRSEATTRRFLSDAAHELRTPITGVQNLAESLVRHPDAELERRERIATTLVRETRRAGALVADMLDLARIEGGGDGADLDRRPVDLAELAVTEADRTALLAPALSVEVTGDPVVVDADPARITQILANLLDNARRHSPAGGVIGMRTARHPDGGAVLEVTDEGDGIPDADRERVFERLVRLDDARGRDRGGAGLGLAIARALARAHGGDLRLVDSERGARFRLTLPAARAGQVRGEG